MLNTMFAYFTFWFRISRTLHFCRVIRRFLTALKHALARGEKEEEVGGGIYGRSVRLVNYRPLLDTTSRIMASHFTY